MKRRILAMMAAMLMLLSLTACGGGKSNNAESNQEQTASEDLEAPVESTPVEDEIPSEEGKKTDIQTEFGVEGGNTAPKDDSSENQPEDNPEVFIEEVTNALDGELGDGEKILSVEKNGTNLIVKVDMSGAKNTLDIPLNLIAENRCTSITDAILELEKDEQWETITIDFRNLGSMTCGKEDIESSKYGRYISPDAIKIQ